MCFSFFNLKSRKGSPKPNSTPRDHRRHHPKKMLSSSSDSHSPNFIANLPAEASSSSANYYYTSKSSISSRTSLSSLKDSLLPENPHIYDFSEIRSAAGNFLMKPIHSSSSSTAWKCTIDGKETVAVQRKLRRPIDTPELRQKLAVICKSHHASIAKLYGACVTGNYIYLVYEYVDGANLSDCLRNRRNPNFTILSNWISRVSIAAAMADAIDYMHNCSGMKLGLGFIHNHIKSSSIVVSENSLTAKLLHFGTAQLCGETADDDADQQRVIAGDMKFAGTSGYMSPEFQFSGVATAKADVYAFGVVLLELLSGEEPLKFEIDEDRGVFKRMSVVEAAREVVSASGGRLRRWVDTRLRDSYPVEVAARLLRVAVECVKEDPEKRPDMGRVAGWISKLFLESKTWADNVGLPTDITVSLGPR